jgi:hypothetical protein
MADMTAMVFLENAADGQTVEDTDRVSQVVAHFDALRGESLPVGASRDLIVKVLRSDGGNRRDHVARVELQRRQRRPVHRSRRESHR